MNMMGNVHYSYSDGCNWKNNLTLKASKKIKILNNRTNRCSLVPSSQMEFIVNDNRKRFPVHLKKGIH